MSGHVAPPHPTNVCLSSLKAVCVVWTHFGVSEDDKDQKEVKCKRCGKTVSAAKGDATNSFNHLEHNHVTEYEEFKAKKERHRQQHKHLYLYYNIH